MSLKIILILKVWSLLQFLIMHRYFSHMIHQILSWMKYWRLFVWYLQIWRMRNLQVCGNLTSRFFQDHEYGNFRRGHQPHARILREVVKNAWQIHSFETEAVKSGFCRSTNWCGKKYDSPLSDLQFQCFALSQFCLMDSDDLVNESYPEERSANWVPAV